MRGLCIIGVLGVWLALPAGASAEPKIVRAGLEQSALTGSGITFAVEATDPKQGVTRMTVGLPDGGGAFGESSCRLDHKGRERHPNGLGAGSRTRFAFPWVPTVTGEQTLDVTITAGACGLHPESVRKQVKVKVGLADLPALPGPKVKARPAQTGCPAVNVVPARGTIPQVRAAVLCLLNVQRAARRLPLLRANTALRKAARRHSRDMIRRSYFDHQRIGGPTLADRLRRVGYWPATAGENIGMGSGPLATPVNMVTAWMDSDGHRENILERRFRDLGVGVVASGGRIAYTTDFGSR